jgi:hypothetical protein
MDRAGVRHGKAVVRPEWLRSRSAPRHRLRVPGPGEPAVDLVVAWYVLPAEAHDAFRTALDTDDAIWARGRGWALSIALLALQAYRNTNPVMAARARHVILEVLSEHEQLDARAAGHAGSRHRTSGKGRQG